MPKLIDLTGQKFGRLSVISRAEDKKKHATWLCLCDCGNEKTVFGHALKAGLTKSCGCIRSELVSAKNVKNTKHGLCRTRTHISWDNMIQRCTNPNHKSFNDYGGRGISVCEKWTDKNSGFINFLRDMGERPEDMTLDRIDGSKGYCKENCRWADIYTQNQNRRKKGKSK